VFVVAGIAVSSIVKFVPRFYIMQHVSCCMGVLSELCQNV
jgi:hypothetical protein